MVLKPLVEGLVLKYLGKFGLCNSVEKPLVEGLVLK